MALNGSSSSSTLRRILSRWKRDSTTTTRASNVGARKMSSTKRFTEPSASATLGSAYSESVKAGKKWKMQARKQMNKRDTVMVEMMTVDELNGQLLPIHKAATEGDIETVRRIVASYPDAVYSTDVHGATALHHAASESALDVMDYLIQKGADLNDQDEQGETPLHWAITFEKPEAMELLLNRGAATDVKTTTWETALHTAVRMQSSHMVTILASHEAVDVNVRGEHERTPLHMASLGEDTDIIDILMANKAYPCSRDGNGLRPIHLASRHGKPHMVNYIIDMVVTHFHYPADQVVNFTDDDGMSSLHQAISGGNVPVAKLLLERGCRVFNTDSRAESPFHLACAQGSVPMIETILNHCKECIRSLLDAKDPTGQTALHKAAIFNHVVVAKFLINKGANINATDDFGRTPLLLSAQAGSKDAMQYLLSQGADTDRRDTNNRNFLHLAIMRENDPVAEFILTRPEFSVPLSLLDDQDALGLTPVHYASKAGCDGPLELMLKLGASRNPKDHKKSTPLHFAARFGQYNAARRLISGHLGQKIINEEDRIGMTPLHIASHCGFHLLVDLFLRKGGIILRCSSGSSPLHSAAYGGYVKCLSALLSSHRYILNWENHQGNTALHIAVEGGHPAAVTFLLSEGAEIVANKAGDSFLDLCIDLKRNKCAQAAIEHERWEQCLSFVNRKRGYPMIRLIQEMPDVAKTALDNSVTCRSKLSSEDKQYWKKYSFKYLLCDRDSANTASSEKESSVANGVVMQQPDVEKDDEPDIADEQETTPLPGLHEMVKYDRKELLYHPVSNALLASRWKSYGRLAFGINTTLYVFYLIFLTSLISLVPLPESPANESTTLYRASNGSLTTIPELSAYAVACQYLVIAFAGANVVKEIIQFFQMKVKYFQDFNNYLELTLYITTLLFVIPMGSTRELYQLEMGAVAIFLAWMNFLLYLQRFEALGIYIVMFVEVVKTLLVVLGVFFVIIVAFGLCFYVLLFPADPMFTNIPKTFLNVFEIMLGEFSFEYYYDRQATEGLRYPTLTWIMLIVLLIFMPIIFMNLLIGLAVGDIEGVRRNAELKRLAMQVEFHTSLESKLPNRIRQNVCHDQLVDYPNKCKGLKSFVSAYEGLTNVGEAPVSTEMLQVKEQLNKQKRRLKDISENMERQHQLLLSLVQKLEITGANGSPWIVEEESESPEIVHRKLLSNARL
ncbi:transient receptor potential cation channel subfamily A member 1-like isoform X2 [Oscarella lobularis]|uniref:transient receptor potential cation channel subfamily A member 1-like isoform X2 n=1 Tax=Oscarella lobularis TaxID=121494 RepID=UPI0033139BC7